MAHEDPSTTRSKLEEEVRRNPDSIQALRNLGSFYLATNNPEMAKEKFLKALELDDTRLDVWIELGSSLMSLKQWKEAEKVFRRVVENDLNHSIGWLNLGIVLARQGNLNDADAAFDMYQFGTSNDVSQEIALARAVAEQELIDEDPEYAKRKENVQQLMGQIMGIFEKHIEDTASQQLRESPKDAKSWRERAELLLYLNRYQDSLIAAQKAVEMNPYLGGAWRTLGKCLMKSGLFVEAILAFSKADALDSQIIK